MNGIGRPLAMLELDLRQYGLQKLCVCMNKELMLYVFDAGC